MCSRFTLLLAQCVCGTFLLVHGSNQERLLTQGPTNYLFSPRDYRAINEMSTATDRSPYILYYVPMSVKDYLMQSTKRNYNNAVITEQSNKSSPKQFLAKKTMLMQKMPYPKVINRPDYPSPYMEPPAPDSASDYVKHHNHRMNAREKQEIDALPLNHQSDVTIENKKSMKKIQYQEPPAYVRDHAPAKQIEPELTSESKVTKKKAVNNDPARTLELSADGERIEFQIQGHEGPKTYIFGYDTGDGKNRQFRLEERLKDGTVKGHYGYYDARGKLRTIKYLARPFEGYQEKHHESNVISAEEK